MTSTDTNPEINGTAHGVKPGTMATINNKRYDLSTLPDTALKLLASVKMSEEEITRLERSITIARAARVAYSQALFAAVKDLPTAEGSESNN